MSGWRDAEGKTAAERKQAKGERDFARLAADSRHRPLGLLKRLVGFGLIVILVFALIGALR
jgi:hypothetical protein